MVRLIITKSSKFIISKVYFSQANIETNVLSQVAPCPSTMEYTIRNSINFICPIN